jgi:hypothetical protein
MRRVNNHSQELEVLMFTKYFARLLRLANSYILFIVTTAVMIPATLPATAGAQSSITFSINRLAENPRQYNLIFSSDDERNISGEFSVDQLQVLRAIMVEAEKFAMSGEAVGDKDPITTRFMDKQEHAFIVDVQKVGNQSLLFLTLTTELGRMTMEAGKAMRATRREEGFFFDLLSRLESMLPKQPKQSGN